MNLKTKTLLVTTIIFVIATIYSGVTTFIDVSSKYNPAKLPVSTIQDIEDFFINKSCLFSREQFNSIDYLLATCDDYTLNYYEYSADGNINTNYNKILNEIEEQGYNVSESVDLGKYKSDARTSDVYNIVIRNNNTIVHANTSRKNKDILLNDLKKMKYYLEFDILDLLFKIFIPIVLLIISISSLIMFVMYYIKGSKKGENVDGVQSSN